MRQRLLASTMVLGALGLMGQAHAQAIQTAPNTTPPPSGTPAFGPQTPDNVATSAGATQTGANVPATTQEVVVTGTLIRRPGLTAAAPVATVSQQEFKLEGATDVVDVVNELPQNGNNLNNTPNPLNNSGGFSTINLRSLGAVRTLVLQDGRRLMPGDPTLGGEAPDIDTIPQQLVSRVDVLTGGSSTTYGSDAVAGVVNFIMRHDFQGVQADFQYGANYHDNDNKNLQGLEKAAGDPAPNGSVYDGQSYNASLIFGVNAPDGKGNVEGYVNYRHEDPVTQGSRDFSGCETAAGATNLTCIGSSNSNYFQDLNAGKVYSVVGNNFVSYKDPAFSPTPPYIFNSNPYEYLSREDDRYQGGMFANYKAANWAEMYGEFSFMDDRSTIHAAPSAAFRGPEYDVPCNSPELSAQQVATVCAANGLGAGDSAAFNIGRRDVEGGARVYNYEHESFRGVLGVRGDVADGLHYDAYGQYGYTKFNYSVQNDLSIRRIQDALNIAPDGTCISGNAGCVPYNIFTTGGVTTAAVNYIRALGTQTGNTEEQIVHAGLTGDLGRYGVRSPFASDGVNVALGAEYRREALVFTPDEESSSGDLAGSGGANPAVNGYFDVYELFGEIDVPVVQDKPFVRLLDFDGAYRFSEYSTAGTVDTYKLSVQYAPSRDLLLRGSFNRAVRAPNTNELFTPATVTNGSYADPCAYDPVTGTAATATLAQCARTGVTAAQYGNGSTTDRIFQCASDQCTVSAGGNTRLAPEQADTVTFGGVFTPKRYIRNLDVAVDYYHIDLKNAISTVSPSIIVNQCINGIDSYCGLIHRNASGELNTQTITVPGYVEGANLNIGRLKTSGIDIDANYRYNLSDLGHGDLGRISVNFLGNYTIHYIDIPAPGLGFYDCAGYFGNGCANAIPRFRSKLRLTYTSPYKFTVSAQWRYIGDMRLDANQPNPLLNKPFDAVDASTGSVSYLDLTATYQVKDGLVLRVGMNNVLDRDPPVLAGASVTPTGAPNTYPIYDLLGRTLFVGLTADF